MFCFYIKSNYKITSFSINHKKYFLNLIFLYN